MKGATGNSNQSLEDSIHRVASDLNEGIQNWINGSVPETDAAFAAIRAATHRGFSYVFTDGGTSVDGAFWSDLRPSWGKNPEFRLATPRRRGPPAIAFARVDDSARRGAAPRME